MANSNFLQFVQIGELFNVYIDGELCFGGRQYGVFRISRAPEALRVLVECAVPSSLVGRAQTRDTRFPYTFYKYFSS